MPEAGEGATDRSPDAADVLTRDGLAVVVSRPDTERAIDALEAEGVYDDARRVAPHGEDHVALPVTAPPEGAEATDLVADVVTRALPVRAPGLADHLRERGWTDAELARAPGSWAVVGTCVLVDLPDDVPRPAEVGEALLALHGEADTVLADHGIAGEHREPSVEVLAGAGDTEVVHVEYGTRYALDLARVMFSPGNKAERARMGDVVGEGERVFDMFAGVGYFTLPMARAGADVVAAEVNPTAYRYLVENAVLNGVQSRVEAYRADCRDVADAVDADRVVMGYYDAHEYLPASLDALVPGGVVHLHEATPEARLWDRPVSRLERAVADAGRDVEVLDRRVVKSHSEGVQHVVLDARVD